MTALSSILQLPTISDILTERGRERPDDTAFVDAAAAITYGELDREATRLAGAFHSFGLRRGDRVAMLVSSGLGFIRAFWGLQRLGATPCAFNPHSPAAIAARRAARIRPALVLFDDAAPPELAEQHFAVPLVPLARLDAAAGSAPPGSGSPEDVAYLQPTSGTAGEPRYAVILQRNVIALFRSMHEALPVRDHDVYVQWIPPWHDFGLVRFVIGAPVAGVPCHLVQPAVHTLPLFLKTIERVRGTVSGAPDFAWRLATRLSDSGLDLSSLRYGGNGGEPPRMTTLQEFDQKFGVRHALRPGYGLAEATLGVAIMREGDEPCADERGNVACGRPTPGLEVRIGESDREEGEILVRGPSVFAGYFDAPEATAEVLRDGWLHTGDTGKFDAEGRLYVLGRTRAMLKRGGAVIAPRELEEAAQRIPEVRLAAAIGYRSHGANTEEIVVAVEIESGAADPERVASAVSGAVQDDLGFAPDGVMVLAPRSIARTWNGKIRHAALRQEIEDGTLAGKDAVLFSGGVTRRS